MNKDNVTPRSSYRVQFLGGMGHQLSGIVDRPSNDHQTRAIAVFSHCFTCNKDLKAIVKISRSMAQQGIAVLRYDMTGLGGSDGDFSKTNFSTNLADLKSAIEYTQRELGVVTGLIGHSFGGAATLGLAGNVNGLCDGLWDHDPHLITLAAPSDTRHLAALLSRMNPTIETAGSGMVSIGGRHWRITQQMLDNFRTHDLTEAIGKISSPTLLMHSPSDETVPFDHALRIMGILNATPDSKATVNLVSLQNSDHLLTNQPEDTEWVAACAAAFLKRHSARQSEKD